VKINRIHDTRNSTRDMGNNNDKRKATTGEVTAERTTGIHVYYGRKDL
jgi:hypothetical protein